MLNIRMSRTPIEGSPVVPGCLTPRRAHLGCGRGSSPELLSAFIPIDYKSTTTTPIRQVVPLLYQMTLDKAFFQ
jgi:hypothetical protein